MATLKTQPNNLNVTNFLNNVENAHKRADSFQLLALMEEITGCKAKMWGSSIVGFDTYHYKYKSGREGDWLLTGFSPRKQNISVYLMCGLANFSDLLKDLGKHKISVSCLYIKKLEDINMDVLEAIIKRSINKIKEMYG